MELAASPGTRVAGWVGQVTGDYPEDSFNNGCNMLQSSRRRKVVFHTVACGSLSLLFNVLNVSLVYKNTAKKQEGM